MAVWNECSHKQVFGIGLFFLLLEWIAHNINLVKTGKVRRKSKEKPTASHLSYNSFGALMK
uniref:Uncharacterized protein n=1 Tax=Glossina palpalis gambiensis TaxID=67801 RepID=A0A1B0B8F1_9MUSC